MLLNPRPARRPLPRRKTRTRHQRAAWARAIFLAQTGGDEGVRDNTFELQATPVSGAGKVPIPSGTE
ncbi:MAG: hypothetical protein WA463_02730 [Terriglobales bacterium]